MKQVLIAVVVGGFALSLAGCRDDVGATTGDVDDRLAQHAADPLAHHSKTIDAGELSAGMLSTSRLDPAFTASVSTNTADIATNVTDIATNGAAIAGNISDIATNGTGVATNAADISTNTTDISTNAGGVATNAADILNLQGDVFTNSGDIGTNQTDISDLQGTVGNLKTGFVSISFANGQVMNNALEWGWMLVATPSSYARVNDSGSFNCVTTTIDLPDSATVNSFSCRLFDNSAGQNVQCSLFQNDPYLTMATITTSVQSTALQTLSDSTIVEGDVNNVDHSYFVTTCAGYDAANVLGAVSAKVDYTIP